MKAIIQIDVPDFQIGQEVSIYFKDTMTIKGIVEESKVDPCDRLKLDGMLEDAYEHGYEQARHDYEVQPCNAVSREAVKKLHCDICMDKNICYRNKENCEELDLFDKLPPITPKQMWIPVSERLPEGLCKTLVSCEDSLGLPIVPKVALYNGYEHSWDCAEKVIAWMPLPEPYKKEGE